MENDTRQESPPLWRLVPLEDYDLPSEPASETVKRGFFGLWDRLGRKSASKKNSRAEVEKELERPSLHLLDRIAPAPDWMDLVSAIQETADRSYRSILVGAPFSGISDAVSSWGVLGNHTLIQPPGLKEVLAGGKDWVEKQDFSGNRLFVIPRLEKFFIRHHSGLDLIRRMLDRISPCESPWLVACDSWAWAYLSKTFDIGSYFPKPFTLGAFDRNRLLRWFQSLAGIGQKDGFVFRLADNGKRVIPGQGRGENDTEEIHFLEQMAAWSRGIPGVAWAAWRRSLRIDAKEEMDPATGKASSILIRPWSKLALPEASSGQERTFVLHTLLIHAGLSEDTLHLTLPLCPAEIGRSLRELHDAGLAEKKKDAWTVTPNGYPSIRKLFESERFLVDAI